MNIYTQRTYTYIHREHIHKMHKKIRGKDAGGRTKGGGVWSGRRRRGGGRGGAATMSGQWLGGGVGEVDQPDDVGAGLGGDGDDEQKASGREETDGFWRKLLSAVYIRRALVPIRDSNRD